MRFKEILSSVTGISVPIFGVQWKPVVADVTVARNVLRRLEDRRVLYRPEEMEGAHYCRGSVEDIRALLTEALQQVQPDTPLGKNFAKLRRACRHFCDVVGSPKFDSQPMPIQTSILSRELGKLRKVAGTVIAAIAIAYGLDVEDELASIIPFNRPL